MKTPQVKPNWATGSYIGNGTVVPDKTTFKVWLGQCDKIVAGKLGFGLHDLADADWMGYYEDDLPPSDACDCAYEDMWSGEMPAELWYG